MSLNGATEKLFFFFFFFANKLVTEIYYDLLKSVLHISHMSHKRENSEELFEDQGHVPRS